MTRSKLIGLNAYAFKAAYDEARRLRLLVGNAAQGPRLASCEAVLAQVGMEHRMTHLPSQLSGGEQQRVCIARALVNEPPVIFADEPTGNLDEENERRVLALLKDLHRQGRTIVMVTHNPALGQFADRVIRLQHGKFLSEERNHALA